VNGVPVIALKMPLICQLRATAGRNPVDFRANGNE
jgi:hypothetical protein